jgi:NADPH2:quinone reductase
MKTPANTTMMAVEIQRPGPPENLRTCIRSRPVAGRGELLIEVAAAGLNRADLGQRQGRNRPPPGASDLPGLEVAGVVAAIGPGVTGWRKGDRVCALLPGGGYAQFAVALARHCLPVPPALSLAEAAALPEACFTVWINVFKRSGLRSGETLLVQGGASGVGTTAIQMANLLGHRVFATAGSDDKCRTCERIGATLAVNYRTTEFAAAVRAANGGKGIDVILDMVAGDYVTRELKLLADGGRLALIAYQGGTQVTANFAEMRRGLTITGLSLRGLPVSEKSAVARALHTRIWPFVTAGKLRPVIHATFTAERAAEAHALMESGAHTGKIVLLFSSSI